MSTKKEQRALKRPDRFQVTMKRQLERIKQNPGVALGIVGIVALVFGAYFIGNYYQKVQLEKRVSALYSADKLYKEELEQVQKNVMSAYTAMGELSQKITALEEKKKPSQKEKAELKSLKKELETKTKAISQVKPNHSASSKEYLAFFEANLDSAEGHRAALNTISGYLGKKDYKAAKELVTRVLGSMSPSSFFYKSTSLLHIKILSELSELETALSEADKLLTLSSDQEQPEVLLLKGVLLLQKNSKEEAGKIFDSLITHFHATQVLKSRAKAYKALTL